MSSAPILYYVHGFNSSPKAHKAQVLAETMESLGHSDNFRVPLLTFDPKYNIQLLEKSILAETTNNVNLVGSSMGGFYAVYLAEKLGIKATLVNPVVDAAVLFQPYLGEITNEHTGEEYLLDHNDIEEFQRLRVEDLQCPENLLLMVQTADEVLDSKISIDKYQQCASVIQQGGSHRFENFDEVVPDILEFFGITKN